MLDGERLTNARAYIDEGFQNAFRGFEMHISELTLQSRD